MQIPEYLINYDNYYAFRPLSESGYQTIYVQDINTSNWSSYADGLLNIMRDSIETDWAHNTKIEFVFRTGRCNLTIPDAFMNIVFWYMIIYTGQQIEAKHVFFNENITQGYIKKWIDKFVIDPNRAIIDNKDLNNIIDNSLYYLTHIHEFELYIANTVNLEDFIDLMKASPRFYEALHPDLNNVPLEKFKDVKMQYTNIAIEEILNSKQYLGHDHCLADSLRTGEGTNVKQLSEMITSEGPKPDGRGGVYPLPIINSYINGGLSSNTDIFIDSSTGRLAQIINKENIGDSGHLARIMGLNNTDTTIHPDPHYDCCTRNFEEIVITSKKVLERLRDRWYRLDPNGVEMLLSDDDTHLIGQKIYLRSPMTCASHARGDGICYKCYGNLAYTIRDINPGRMAAEESTSGLTQRLLSAKHILDVKTKELTWTEPFKDWIDVYLNILRLPENRKFNKNQFLVIDKDNIMLEEDDDYTRTLSSLVDKLDSFKGSEDLAEITNEAYNEYITEFTILDGTKEYSIHTEDYHKIYITGDLNRQIREFAKGTDDGKIVIPLDLISDCDLFYVSIQNNELSEALDRFSDILNKQNITLSMDRNQILQSLLETSIECGLGVMSVHLEVILSNQIRSVDDILDRPYWEHENEPYQLLTLDQALTANVSIIVSMLYQKLSRLFINPLSFRKNGPSFLDMLFMKSPQTGSDYIIKDDRIKKPKRFNPIIIDDPKDDKGED